ncbi:GSCOCG00006291001-RA-CDS [Cotesia congregata]|nr:GSCOCG00006291001-RA-CDS [Cotesia congregata]
MQEILKKPSFFCQVPKDEVDRYFRIMYSDDSPLEADLPDRRVWPPDDTGELTAALKRADPSFVLLTAVYNACMRLGTIPASWKVSNTVLIHKTGDRNDLSNWRPLAMGNTVYKLFATLIADRITSFVVAGQRLSPSQKRFSALRGMPGA